MSKLVFNLTSWNRTKNVFFLFFLFSSFSLTNPDSVRGVYNFHSCPPDSTKFSREDLCPSHSRAPNIPIKFIVSSGSFLIRHMASVSQGVDHLTCFPSRLVFVIGDTRWYVMELILTHHVPPGNTCLQNKSDEYIKIMKFVDWCELLQFMYWCLLFEIINQTHWATR